MKKGGLTVSWSVGICVGMVFIASLGGEGGEEGEFTPVLEGKVEGGDGGVGKSTL